MAAAELKSAAEAEAGRCICSVPVDSDGQLQEEGVLGGVVETDSVETVAAQQLPSQPVKLLPVFRRSNVLSPRLNASPVMAGCAFCGVQQIKQQVADLTCG